MKNISNVTKCTGCSGCSFICPQNIIKMELDEYGFIKPVITDKKKCIQCGLCLKICPSMKNVLKQDIYSSYSAVSKDKEIMKTCSSGGIAYEIANYMITQGYYLCGCRYNLKLEKAEHIVVDNIEDYEECKGSKYIQSNVEKAICRVLDLLKEGKKVVFFGTPCQVASMRNIAEEKKLIKNLILVDFFCHGVPTYFLWKNYISYLKNEKNMDISKIKKVNFRDKNKGWHEFTITVETESGEIFSQSFEEKNWFFRFFLSNVVLNDACYSCKYRATISEADIRIGDLWGEKYQEDRKGVSGILCFSNKGNEIIENLKDVCEIKEEKIETVIEEQMKENNSIPIFRKKIIKSLRKNKKFSNIYNFQVIPAKIYRKLRGGR